MPVKYSLKQCIYTKTDSSKKAKKIICYFFRDKVELDLSDQEREVKWRWMYASDHIWKIFHQLIS